MIQIGWKVKGIAQSHFVAKFKKKKQIFLFRRSPNASLRILLQPGVRHQTAVCCFIKVATNCWFPVMTVSMEIHSDATMHIFAHFCFVAAKQMRTEIFCVPTATLTTLTGILHSKQIKDKVRDHWTLEWKDETKLNNTLPKYQTFWIYTKKLYFFINNLTKMLKCLKKNNQWILNKINLLSRDW